MEHCTATALHRAGRQGARALVALLACVAVTAAWSSQRAGGTIGQVLDSGTSGTSTAPAPKPAASGATRTPSRAASSATH